MQEAVNDIFYKVPFPLSTSYNFSFIFALIFFQSLKVDEVFLQGALTDEDGRFNCEDIVRLLKYGEGLK